MSNLEWSEGVLRLLRKLNSFDEPGSSKPTCVPFIVNGQNVGILQQELVKELANYPGTFTLQCNQANQINSVELNEKFTTYDERSEAVLKVVQDLKKKNAFLTLRYWRNEDYDVASGPGQPALLKVERAATSLFGVRAYGAHVNGYVKHPERGFCIWLGRRSPKKETYPGMWDNVAAGGLGVGFGIRETMIKECYEEASIPENIAENMISVGCASYTIENDRGIGKELQYCFDLELPLDFTPKPLDGEMQTFTLFNIDEIKNLIIQDNFKPNCAAITLDFLIRHGFVTPDNEPKYAEIVQRMCMWS
ncbi:uncharacterized protein LOC120335663 [Styela clava]